MIFEPRSLENHEKNDFLMSLTISFMKILIFFLNSDFLPDATIYRNLWGSHQILRAIFISMFSAAKTKPERLRGGSRKGYKYFNIFHVLLFSHFFF